MASPEILNFDALVKPISPSAPAGINLREDSSPTSLYYRIKDARTASRKVERDAASGEVPAGGSRWRELERLATEALLAKSKDLEVSAWLVEALVREHGFAGLRDGFRLMREIVVRFWVDVYPRPDEDGLTTRVAPIAGLNGSDSEGTLITPIALVPLTQAADVGPFSAWHWRQANEIARIPDAAKREDRIAAGGVSLETVQGVARRTSADFFRAQIADLVSALDEYQKLGAALDTCCEGHSPPSSNIRSALEAALEDLRAISRDVLPAEPDSGAAVAANGSTGTADRTGGGALQSREEALRALSKVADYFRRTEPHSPVSYLLEQSARWGRMPLHELLPELIADTGARDQFCKLTGIKLAKE